jgi:hypothetical protein
MNHRPDVPAAKPRAGAAKPLGRAVFDRLASVKFAVSVVILIVLACIAGTWIPQGADVARYLEQHPAAARRLALFGKLGLTHVFSSVWFVGLLGVLAASVATCSLRRFATVRVARGGVRLRAFGSMLTHLSILLILAGGVVRGLWGVKGQLELREGQTASQFRVERGLVALPFAVHLAAFDLDTYATAEPDEACDRTASADAPQPDCCNQLLVEWPERKLVQRLPTTVGVEHRLVPEGATEPETVRVKILRYVPDFTIDTSTRQVSSRSEDPNNPAILVAVQGAGYENQVWLFAKFPDFGMHGSADPHGKPMPVKLRFDHHAAPKPKPPPTGPIKNFRSTLKIIEAGAVVQTPQVEVNRPFRYRGYSFYQAGYNPRDLSWTSLQVVRDPGVPLVYAGFALMIAGLFIVFYVNPWLQARRARP